MRKIKIEKIIKKGNRIVFEYSQTGLESFIDQSIKPYYEYNCNVENVPDSIAAIPFVANLIPLCFVLDAEIEIDCLDQAFLDCIDPYRQAYKEMIPMIGFGGKVSAVKTERNEYAPVKNCLLFSGGIDATNSLAVNADEIADCITIWGSDIRDDNESGWKAMSEAVEDAVLKFKKNWIVIKSNFRAYINESTLGKEIAATGDNWWHAMQHGIALLGQVAPLAYLNKYKTIFIASSFTKDYQPICASDPRTDNCFKCASAAAKHDGFEFDRCQKVENIEKKRKELNTTFHLHVCWESTSGHNCGHCEKCLRSYLNCRAVNADYASLGIEPSLTMKEIKSYCRHKILCNDAVLYRFNVLKSGIERTYGKNVPDDLKWVTKFNPKKVNSSFYWLLKRCYGKVKRVFKR